MSSFAERQPGLHPTALRNRWGAAWGRAFGLEKDDVVTAAKLAVRSGFVDDAPADALPRHAADVALPQLAGEADTDLRARIATAWDFWPTAGRLDGLTVSVGLLGYATVEIRTATQFGLARWAQWFIVAYGTGVKTRQWGAPATWGSGVWGSDATRERVRAARRFLRLIANARDIGWLIFSSSTPGVWGLGTWGAPAVWGGAVTRWRI